jgi:VWFA-related protein
MRLQKVAKFVFYVVLVALSTGSFASGQEQPQSQSPATGPKSIVNVTVTDRKHHPVTGLKAEDFAVSDNGEPQQIDSVSAGVPACIGLVVDASGSMRHKLPGVAVALLDFVRAGHEDDRVFVVNFNDQPYLDVDFTHNVKMIEEALRRADARGGTALYDALIASADHLVKGRDCRKRVLVVVSDGNDNSSRENLEQTIRTLENSQGCLVYAISLAEENPSVQFRDRRALDLLTAATGGRLFNVGDGRDSGKALLQAQEEIRSQYTISYVRSQNASRARASKLKIEIHAQGYKDLIVRTSVPVRTDGPEAKTGLVPSGPRP